MNRPCCEERAWYIWLVPLIRPTTERRGKRIKNPMDRGSLGMVLALLTRLFVATRGKRPTKTIIEPSAFSSPLGRTYQYFVDMGILFESCKVLVISSISIKHTTELEELR